MARARRAGAVQKAQDAYTDSSVVMPQLDFDATSWSSMRRDLGSYGLRQFGGYIREEFLPSLRGRELSRTYREMLDNEAVVGSVIFAITQAMRSVRWRDVPANDSPKAREAAEFSESLRHDMSHSWEDFIAEALTMIGYGFAPMELVFKKRLGRKPGGDLATSKFDDGLIGFRRIPLRGQDTILKWFFDSNGQVTGLTQMPWVGRLIDLPIEKLLIFRPTQHKNSPEGRSALRNSVRAYHFIKRLEEMEAILFERLSGIPVAYIPNQIIVAAQAGDKNARATYEQIKKMVRNVRINEQMGIVLPSDRWPGANGPSTEPMYKFELVTPQAGHVVDPGVMISRYKLDILKSVLADFIDLGHQARGTQQLAITKIDMFYKAIEGWLHSIASGYNRYGVDRIWQLNGMDDDLMPRTEPDMVSRVDLNQLGNFVFALARSGIDMTDPDIEAYLRAHVGMPDISEEAGKRERNEPVNQPGNGLEKPQSPSERAAGMIVNEMVRAMGRQNKTNGRAPNVKTRPAGSKAGDTKKPPRRAAKPRPSSTPGGGARTAA